MDNLKKLEVWFVTGTQHLYGPETLKQVAADSTKISAAFDKNPKIPVKVVFKPILTTPDSITELCTEANTSKNCIGLITWMHTFSPAKMWIRGLSILNKPFLHFHTQLNRDIPWESIDMNFMNLNQSAHGDREFGFIGARMRLNRKIVVGHYEDQDAVERIAVWIRAASAYNDALNMKVARFGDNMRDVAVTEGNWKTAALVRSMKVMSAGLKGGTSFMEDYTYHFDPKGMRVLGAHMLEVCPSIAHGKPSVEIHQLSIGGKEDPARLVFKTAPGNAINVSVIDLGNRFRMIVNEVEVVKCPDMPNLPVASVLWKPQPDLKTGAAAWIMAGGAHHTGFSTSINAEYLEDFANMMGVEYLLIGEKFDLASFKNELRWNELYYHISDGII